ncbi:hypothetical protein IMSHALPRED_011069 [Imshaugia aleurites]|uniref:Phosphatidic acid phosphatase type 2/haloperoxidase domain-containing protein n=1 Tax=Imshaugia aleurites TaxID=172621 RepID=A0A8H3GC95_9LECA|nr:hypothetical protein IMSHALPRED_011069 [Imshaugia aleurites]
MPRTTGKKTAGQDGGFLSSVSGFWKQSYAADYVGFALLLLAYSLIQVFIEPFHRMFSLDNISIQYPHAAIERVPVIWNVAYSVFLPLCIFFLWAIISRPGLHKTNVTILGLAISIMLTTFMTDVVKNSVGRPRPDLVARCKPRRGTPEHTLITIGSCTETNHHILHDGWRSFPSGHSSLAFSGLGYLALFFAGQMHVFRPRTDLARVLLALAPLVGAALIAISRLEDYRHDVYDVTTGSTLGMVVAYFSYRRYYPVLNSLHCDTPFPSRAEWASKNGFGKLKDEESRVGSADSFDVDDMEDGTEQLPLRAGSRDRSRLLGGNSDP